jgi:PEP-CTERM motif
MRKKRTAALVLMLIAAAGVSVLVCWGVVNRHRVATVMRTAGFGWLVPHHAPITSQAAPPAVPTEVPNAAVPKVNLTVIPRANPYAVVRHGICVPSDAPDQEEASRKKWEALLGDPFWQSIFSGVDPENFHLEKTSLALDRYVTYWKMEKGHLIHWTGKKVLIPAGTRVFANRQGDMYLCACGNRVAAVLPSVSTVLPLEDEPPVAFLVPSELGLFPVVPEGLSGTTRVPPPEPPIVATTLPGGGLELYPPAPILVGGSPPPVRLPGGGPVVPVPNVPPVVPEPGTLSLTLIGIGASILARYRRNRR